MNTFLIISPEPWAGLKVSKHHYALELSARGFQVFYLGPSEEVKYSVDGITILQSPSALPGIRFLPRLIQYYFLKRQWHRIVKMNGLTKIDIVWSFDPSRLFDFRVFKNARYRILHLVDYNQWFQAAIAAQTSDLSIGVSDYIVKRLKAHNENTIKVSHGYHCKTASSTKVDLPGKQSLKAIYIGNLDIQYLDWSIVRAIVDEHEEVDFIFMGKHIENTNASFEGLRERTNFFHLSPKAPELVASYLAAADLCLLAYRSDEFPEQLANPHKMLEYLASGKTIVSTYCHEFRNFKGILMTKNNNEFSKVFSQAIGHISENNTLHKQRERKAQALANSYESKVDQVLQNLGK